MAKPLLTLNLASPVAKLPRVRPLVAKRLKNLGVETIRDLLLHLPRRYEDFSNVTAIRDVQVGETASVKGEVVSIKSQRTWRKRMMVTEAVIADGTGSVRAVWFNQPYLTDSLRHGYLVAISGKVSLDNRGLFFSHPSHEVLRGAKTEKGETETLHTGRLVPIYPETAGLTSRWLRFLIQPLVKSAGEFPDPLPAETLRRHALLPFDQALRHAHFPTDFETAKEGRRRLAFEELLLIQLAHRKARQKVKTLSAHSIRLDLKTVKSFVASLPFALTNAQRKAAWEILQDLAQPHPMARLLEGDVGSGKTAVAAIAAATTAHAGLQTAFMAPTEILARQHYLTLNKLFSRTPHSIGLLTSSAARLARHGAEETISKRRLAASIEAELVDVLVGTHAIIQKNVRIPNLAFVVVDEQHRFGVNQRSALIRGQTQTKTQTNADKLLFRELTYQIRGCAFTVKHTLGLGHKEVVYQRALEEEFKKGGLRFEKEKRLSLRYAETNIGTYQPDFVIEDKIIVEVKSVPFTGEIEKKQLWSYLKGSSCPVALLVNFGGWDVEIHRLVYDAARHPRQSASSLRESALVPHLLSMSATPIPRTLALTIYGDLDLSILDELPKGRQPIETRLIAPAERNDAYEFIRKQARDGRQVFVICPRIDPTTQTNADSALTNADTFPRESTSSPRPASPASELAGGRARQSALALWEAKAVTDEYKKLSEKIFPDLNVGMLHGKLPAKDKARVMASFAAGDLDILVSTSVVEVGVDIPNATVMMIEGAEHFGLAQLYQFRGRVGRAEHQSHCLLFTESTSRLARERLKAIVEAKSGFELAEKDLQLRGPGDFLGARQSGLPDLAMASLSDGRLIKAARTEAELLFQQNADLARWPLLKHRLTEFEAEAHLE